MNGDGRLGLPAIALALLAATVGAREAIALMLVPAMVTSVRQVLATGNARAGHRVVKLGYWPGWRHRAPREIVNLAGVVSRCVSGAYVTCFILVIERGLRLVLQFRRRVRCRVDELGGQSWAGVLDLA